MFNFKTFIDFSFDIFFIALSIFFIVLPMVMYKRYRKTWDKEKTYWAPSRFFEYIFEDKIPMGISFLSGVVFVVLSSCFIVYDAAIVVSNRYEEPAIYEQYVERGKVISDSIEVSNDIINTELYNNAISYNTTLAEIKAKYTDPNFSMNFTGDYDWGAIPYISLKGE